jgi:hypothetical protein
VIHYPSTTSELDKPLLPLEYSLRFLIYGVRTTSLLHFWAKELVLKSSLNQREHNSSCIKGEGKKAHRQISTIGLNTKHAKHDLEKKRSTIDRTSTWDCGIVMNKVTIIEMVQKSNKSFNYGHSKSEPQTLWDEMALGWYIET